MLKNILKQQGVRSLNKQNQKSISGGFATPDDSVPRCRRSSDCTNHPAAFCMQGYCFI